MVFSTNQNRQLYVVDELHPAVGGSDAQGNIFFKYTGAGGVIRTDLIDPESVTYAKVTAPSAMEIKLKKAVLALDSEVNSGAPIAGQDYIVRINFRQLFGMSDEDIYQKYGAVHATKAMEADADLFYLQLADSLVKNFKRTYSPLLDIALVSGAEGEDDTTSAAITSIKKVNGAWKVNGADAPTGIKGIAIIEKSQVADWSLGNAQLTRVNFEVIPTTVYDGASDVFWGTVTVTNDGGTVGNGYNTADLEYFCMGERGDQYRKMGYPNTLNTKFLVDPTATYYYLDIHFSYKGTCEDIQKSEKDITFVSTSQTYINALKSTLTTAGITVA